MRALRVGLRAQALLYIFGGINHFWHEAFYRSIMPDHYAHPAGLVRLSGAAEILGGLGLVIPVTRRWAAGGIVAMLVTFLDVHVFMLRAPQRFPDVPRWALWARLAMQGVLIAWAWHYVRDESNRERLLSHSQPLP